jgi:GNAT superfamily N-acetyltransferase
MEILDTLEISAIADGTEVGMARLITDGTQALMMDVVAHPHFQGRGIGKSLMEHIVQYIENTHSNALPVHSMTPGVNTGFYETLGFGKHSSNNIIAMRLQCAMCYIAVPPYCRGSRPRLSAKRRPNHGSS